MRGQTRLVGLRAPLEERGDGGDPDAAPDGADEVEEAGGVAELALAVACLVRDWELALEGDEPEVAIRRKITMGPRHGVRVRVLRRLGSGLDQRAIDAVRQWRFAPARLKGVPVDVIVEVAVEFQLR